MGDTDPHRNIYNKMWNDNNRYVRWYYGNPEKDIPQSAGGREAWGSFLNKGVSEFHLKKEEGREQAGGKGSPRQRETGVDATDLNSHVCR